MKLFLLLALALPLAAQESVKSSNGPTVTICQTADWKEHPECVGTDRAELEKAKARIAYLEQRLALTEQKCAALANFYAAQQALDQQKPPEPPKDEKK